MSNYLPTELLIEILQKLPVKPLVRFTTVCKSWRSIITSTAFIESHLSTSKNQTLILPQRRGLHDNLQQCYSLLKITEDGPFGVKSSSEVEFPINSSFRIVGSCDGLIACSSSDLFRNPSPPTIIIWNPSVRNHVVLPKPTIDPEGLCPAFLGFGVAAGHAHYKVVRLVYYDEDSTAGISSNVTTQIEIFSLKKWSWRSLSTGVDFSQWAHKYLLGHAFSNGVVHWFAEDPINDYRISILGFDMGDEVFSEVMLPDELASACYLRLSILVIGESLGVVKNNEDNKSCDVWTMKESWTKLYRIDMLEGIERVFVVGFWKSGEVLLALRNHDESATNRVDLVAYDPNTRRIKDLGINGTNTLFFYINDYVESLLLVRGHDVV